MFCPKCRGEFREGFTFCNKCNVELVDELPPEETVIKKLFTLSGLMKNKIEKWLQIGGIIYIIIGIIYAIANFINRFVGFDGRIKIVFDNNTQACLSAINLCYSIFDSIIWGLFFFGFGRIAEILKEGLQNEKE
jgi:hypothetical protein